MTATTPNPPGAPAWDAWAEGTGLQAAPAPLDAPASQTAPAPRTAPAPQGRPATGGDPVTPPPSGAPVARPAVEVRSAQDAVDWPAPPPNRSPRWARWALGGLLAVTAVLYLWGLDRNGWANAFYSAAAQAGGTSWKAWFFGSLDAANAITVDKPPASLWLMGLSVRLFGLSSWSILVPQALLGVASVGILYATVRRWFGAPAGLVAGAVLALTPVATLMFRFNNPDALLVFLLVCAAWAMGHAVERASWRWIVLGGGLAGFAFLAKSLQAFLVLPGFVAMYALAAPVGWGRRIGHLLAACGAMILAGGWWVAVAELWPADSRPFIGGSQTNSVLELVLGYNGLGRLTGNETGSVGGGRAQGSMWGQTGWGRLLDSSYGGQAAWLLPAAVVLLAVLLWVSRRAPRTDLTRAAAIGWGGWLLVTAAVISFSQGIIHQYYTVALAPAIAALAGIGTAALWAQRGRVWARVTAAGLVGGSAWWAWVLLGRSAQFAPWLRPVVLLGGMAAAAGILLAPAVTRRWRTRLALGATATGILVLLAGPAAYSLETVATVSTGSLPSAGPSVTNAQGGFGRGPGGQGVPGGGGGLPGGGRGGPPPGATGGPGAMRAPGGPGTSSLGGGPSAGGSNSLVPPGGTGTLPGLQGNIGRGQGETQAGPSGVAGGLLDASTPGAALTAALLEDADGFTWVAAAVGAQSAAGYQLATERPVMAIGGFNGSDPSPTLEQFQALVAEGRIHYLVASGRGGGLGVPSGGAQTAAEISAWVQQSFTARTIDGVTVYDLTATAAGGAAGTTSSSA